MLATLRTLGPPLRHVSGDLLACDRARRKSGEALLQVLESTFSAAPRAQLPVLVVGLEKFHEPVPRQRPRCCAKAPSPDVVQHLDEQWLDEFEFSQLDASKKSQGWFLATADLRASYTRRQGAILDDRMLKKLLEDRGAASGQMGHGRVRGYWGMRVRRLGSLSLSGRWHDRLFTVEVSDEAVREAEKLIAEARARIAAGEEVEEDDPFDPEDEVVGY